MTSVTNIVATSVRPFAFESYGVFVKIESDHQEIILKAEEVIRTALLNNVRPVGEVRFDHIFELKRDETGMYYIIQNGEKMAAGDDARKFYKFFDGILRVAVAEYAVDHVFLHAGVVGWKGKAIIMPADSFQGKSTLVAELVRNGAEYYSDEFAILDRDGLVHSFPRKIGMRTDDYLTYELTVEDLGGKYGREPIPVGMVLLTGYRSDGKWDPEILTTGNGVLKMIPFTLSIRYRTDFSMEVLHNIASHAIIASSLRGSAESFAKTLLNFVDNHVN